MQKPAYEMRISDWSSDLWSSDLLGSAIVRRFAAEGARVLAADVDAPGLDRLAADLPGVRTCVADITRADGVAALFAAMIEGFGRIDILVNNAGIGGPRTQRLHELALDDFDARSEEHTSELQSLMRISYAVFCLKKKKNKT